MVDRSIESINVPVILIKGEEGFAGMRKVFYLPTSLQVPKVDVWNEEDWLRIQVAHGFEESCVTSLLLGCCVHFGF